MIISINNVKYFITMLDNLSHHSNHHILDLHLTISKLNQVKKLILTMRIIVKSKYPPKQLGY